MTNYPNSLDNSTTLPPAIPGSVNEIPVNALRDAIFALETELGILPKGAYQDTRTRLDVLEARINSGNGVVRVVGTPVAGDFIVWNGTAYVPEDSFDLIKFNGISNPPLSTANNSILYYDVILNKLRVSNNGAPYVDAGSGGGGTSFVAGGDLSGSETSQNVIKLRGTPISSTPPIIGQVLSYNGSAYVPSTPSTGFTAGGDLSGTSTSQTVIALQSVSVATTTPIQSAVPVFDTAVSKYSVRKLTLDDLGPAFAINSFAGGSTVECGATVTNPSFTASYASAASSAQITNTDGTDSPKVLISPFTSGTVTGAFSKSTITSVTFTLTAIAATTKTATTSISFLARAFAGIGTAGATSATASGSTAVLVGATGTLSSLGLFSSVTNAVTGTLAPTNQKIYFFCSHTASVHTFRDQNGFSFPMNSPSTFNFTNQNGAVISYDLYESTNLLSTNFILTVVT